MSITADPGAENAFLHGSLPALFVRTAAPIIFIMALNGLITVVDAWFLGVYVGADALTAVTLMFPLFMILIALQTLVSGGMASSLARALGAGDLGHARQVFVSAHALALLVCLALIAVFAAFGPALIDWIAHGSADIGAMGHVYIAILVWASPIAFFLSVNADALRCEGKFGLMTIVTIFVALGNILLDYVFIGVFDLGVAGSAYGTVGAQVLAMAFVVVYRLGGNTRLKVSELSLRGWRAGWGRFAALGAPQSLNFIGLSLTSAAVISALQVWSQSYDATVAAYGIITRVMTFTFLPLMGLSMAMQTIVGNNYGARLWLRSDAGLQLAAVAALVYCAAVQAVFLAAGRGIAMVFVDDPATVAEVTRILPVTAALYFAVGPVMMLSAYFQAIGDAGRAATISITRTYGLTIPLTLLMPLAFGEFGVWLASPVSAFLSILLVAAVLAQARGRNGLRWGLFHGEAEGAAIA